MQSIRRALRARTAVWLSVLPLVPAAAGADDALGSRPDAHAPLGVMGDHLDHAGEWMPSYRWSRMRMDGNRSGTSPEGLRSIIGTPGAPGPFMVAPTDMDVEMDVLGLMVAPTSRVTLMGMLPYVRKTMHHLRRDGIHFRTSAEGLGDVRGRTLVMLFRNAHHRVHLNAGLSFPTGSVSERDALPAPLLRQRLARASVDVVAQHLGAARGIGVGERRGRRRRPEPEHGAHRRPEPARRAPPRAVGRREPLRAARPAGPPPLRRGGGLPRPRVARRAPARERLAHRGGLAARFHGGTVDH